MIRIFKVFVPASVIALLVSEVVLLYCCYIVATYYLVDIDAGVFLFYDTGLTRVSLVVAILVIGLYLSDLYTTLRVSSKILLLQQFCLAVGVAFLFESLLSYGFPSLVLPKWIMIAGSTIALVLVPAWRVLYSRVVARSIGAERLLFLGCSSVVEEIIAHVGQHPELGLSVAGVLGEDGAEPPACDHALILGTVKDLPATEQQIKPDRIVVGLSDFPVRELLDARFHGIAVEEAASTYEAAFSRVCTRELRPSQLIFTHEFGPRRSRVALQSIYSFVFALIAAVVTLPLMLIVAVLVRLTSAGPVLYRQQRVGLHDVTFTLLKFRSMYKDAELATGAVWADKDDPRVTPVGRWLRRLRLDELPQLFNVLRGEMAIVGPRPERPEFVKILMEKIPYFHHRHCVRPGITGWAQINHKYGNTIEDSITKLEYDLYYIKNLDPAFDAFIIFHTLKVMLLSRGAH